MSFCLVGMFFPEDSPLRYYIDFHIQTQLSAIHGTVLYIQGVVDLRWGSIPTLRLTLIFNVSRNPPTQHSKTRLSQWWMVVVARGWWWLVGIIPGCLSPP